MRTLRGFVLPCSETFAASKMFHLKSACCCTSVGRRTIRIPLLFILGWYDSYTLCRGVREAGES